MSKRHPNYNCKKCGELVHAKALPDSFAKEQICYQCWAKTLEKKGA